MVTHVYGESHSPCTLKILAHSVVKRSRVIGGVSVLHILHSWLCLPERFVRDLGCTNGLQLEMYDPQGLEIIILIVVVDVRRRVIVVVVPQ